MVGFQWQSQALCNSGNQLTRGWDCEGDVEESDRGRVQRKVRGPHAWGIPHPRGRECEEVGLVREHGDVR